MAANTWPSGVQLMKKVSPQKSTGMRVTRQVARSTIDGSSGTV